MEQQHWQTAVHEPGVLSSMDAFEVQVSGRAGSRCLDSIMKVKIAVAGLGINIWRPCSRFALQHLFTKPLGVHASPESILLDGSFNT